MRIVSVEQPVNYVNPPLEVGKWYRATGAKQDSVEVPVLIYVPRVGYKEHEVVNYFFSDGRVGWDYLRDCNERVIFEKFSGTIEVP